MKKVLCNIGWTLLFIINLIAFSIGFFMMVYGIGYYISLVAHLAS